MLCVGLMPGGFRIGHPGGYSLNAPCARGKEALVLTAWEPGTAVWQVELALGPLAQNQPVGHDDFSPLQANMRAQIS